MARLKFSARSLADLDEIWERIALDSVCNADSVHDRIFQKFDLLLGQPRAGHPRNDLKPGLRAMNSDGYMIFYHVRGSDVGISRIVHHSRDLSSIDFTEAP